VSTKEKETYMLSRILRPILRPFKTKQESRLQRQSPTLAPPLVPGPEPRIGPKPELTPAPEPEPELNLTDLLSAWGTYDATYDLNKDGIVDGADLGIFLLRKSNEEKEEDRELILYPQHGVLTSRFPTPPMYDSIHILEEEEEMNKVAKNRAGAETYYIWYASWDGEHGRETGSLSINEDVIIENVRKYYKGEEPTGYGQLDYEGNFFRGLDAGKGTPENEEATRVMLKALRRMKQEFPKMKWTYYGLPILKYWLPHPSPTNSYTWVNAPEEVKKQEIEHKYGCYEELLAECDWFNPSFYNRYDPDTFNHDIVARESQYRRELVRFCRLFNERQNTNKPIIPMTCPWYVLGGRVEYDHKIVQDKFMIDTVIQPYLEEGVNGFALWYAHSYWARLAFNFNPSIRQQVHYDAFMQNYDQNPGDFDLENMTREESGQYLNFYMEKSSETILNHMKVMRSTIDRFYSA